ncbi:MAG: acyl-CoA dehydrogenase family protein [Thermodesulfobacteriota bacterium]
MKAQESSLEEAVEIKNLAKQIARERIASRSAERDVSGEFPRECLRILGEAGLMGAIIPEAQGGSGTGRLVYASIVQELAGACASTALIYVSHSIVAKALELFGSEATRKKWLPGMATGRTLGAFAVHEPDSGCNAGAIRTTATRDGDFYIVNGSKIFITSAGEADIYMILVRTDPEKGPQGMSLLILDKDTAGLSFGRPEDRMGMRSTSSREMFFSDCRVPVQNLVGAEGGMAEIMGKVMMGWGFFGAAAISVGIAKSATEIAVKHAKERTISGQPIGVHQAVQSMITDMILGSESAEALLHACAASADSSPSTAVINGLKAKLFASEVAIAVSDTAIQVLGGHGYCRDYVVERLFRDARGLKLHFKTSELLRQDIAKAALGL